MQLGKKSTAHYSHTVLHMVKYTPQPQHSYQSRHVKIKYTLGFLPLRNFKLLASEHMKSFNLRVSVDITWLASGVKLFLALQLQYKHIGL